MKNPSGSTGSMPADEARPNWDWMRERLPETSLGQFENWLRLELAELESHFTQCVTHNSQQRALRAEFSQDR